jgi:hypothetical protein
MKVSNPSVPRAAIQSSSIRSVGYSHDLETLEIEFIGGRIYRYLRVSSEVYQRFIGADSKGMFFNRFIKGRFDYERI